jgi:hypothetical protein
VQPERRSISAQISSTDVEAEVGAEAVGQLGGDHPVGPGGAGRRDLLVQDGDATLEVGGGAVDLGEPGGRQHDVGFAGGVVGKVSTAMTCGHRPGRGGRARGRGSRRADRHRAAPACRSCRRRPRPGCRRCRAPRRRARCPTPGRTRPALVETRPDRAAGPGPCRGRWRRARCRDAGRSGSGRRGTRPAARWRRPRWHRGTRPPSRGRGSTVSGPAARARRAHGRSSSPSPAATLGRPGRARRPGRVAERVGGQVLSVVSRGASSTRVAPAAGDRVADPQEQHRQLVLEVGAEHQHGAAGGAGLVDGGAGQAGHHRGREAVTQLGVDVVGADDTLGQLGPGVGGLVGEAGAADDGEPPGPRRSSPALMARAAAARASAQRTSDEGPRRPSPAGR